MNGVDLLVKEHDNILLFIEKVRKSCKEIMNGKEVDTDLFRKYISFARNYADAHHHGKEELILFKIMVDELGPVAEKLIKHGMLVEHDFGRLFMASLEEALDKYDQEKNDDVKLDIIANAIGYGNLLKRHIDKENAVVYTFATRELSDELLARVDEETKVFEEKEDERRREYLELLNQF